MDTRLWLWITILLGVERTLSTGSVTPILNWFTTTSSILTIPKLTKFITWRLPHLHHITCRFFICRQLLLFLGTTLLKQSKQTQSERSTCLDWPGKSLREWSLNSFTSRRVKARVLLASTSEIYGDPEVHPQPETCK